MVCVIYKPPSSFIWTLPEVHDIKVYRPESLILVFDLNPEILASGNALVYLERYDSSTLGSTTSAYINHPNVKAVFKHYTTADCGRLRRLHFDSGSYNQRSPPRLDKVYCVPWCLKQYTHLVNSKMLKLAQAAPIYEKPIDIFYVVHDHAEKPALYAHRQAVRRILQQLTGKYVIEQRRDVNSHEYLDLLLQSKVCIAPYGLGERISLDQMGILAQCYIIKPPMEHLKTYPNIYTWSNFIYVTHDWSNLVGQLQELLRTYSGPHALLATKEALMKYDQVCLEDHFKHTLHIVGNQLLQDSLITE